MTAKTMITIEANIKAPIEQVWECYTLPEHIIKWNNASENWHTPRAENDLRAGGKFVFRMEAKDESMGFDFGGVYDEVEEKKIIKYTIGDGRKVAVQFIGNDKEAKVVINFEAENENSTERQREGWQAILDNFKKYVETR